MALAESATIRAAESPAGKIVTDWRAMFHALRARKVAVSVAPPTAKMPIFLPVDQGDNLFWSRSWRKIVERRKS